MTPSTKTKRYLEEQGYHVWRTEYWNPFARKRIDLYNFGDYLAFKSHEKGCIIVQATDYSNFSKHKTKIKQNPFSKLWIQDKDRKIWLIGWRWKKMKIEEIK